MFMEYGRLRWKLKWRLKWKLRWKCFLIFNKVIMCKSHFVSIVYFLRYPDTVMRASVKVHVLPERSCTL